MNKDYANYLLEKTKADYNRIAGKFSSTRGYISSDILDLKKYVKSGDKILDAGCGNGRLSEVVRNMKIDYTGIDNSREMIKIAKDKYSSERFILSEIFNLPFKDNSFDKVFSLSVVHHVPSKECRIEFLKEIKRVLKPNRKLILTSWYFGQEKVKKYLTDDSELDKGDIYYPFKDPENNIEVMRYIHCFQVDEMRDLFQKSGFKVVEDKIVQRGKKIENKNILIVGSK